MKEDKMKDSTENELREERPEISAKEAVKFCLKQLFQDKEHTLEQEVALGLIYEEVIGALLLAEDFLNNVGTRPNTISKEQLYYITQLYPEVITIDEAKAEYDVRVEKKEIDDSWWETAAKTLNNITCYAEPIFEIDIVEVGETDYIVVPSSDIHPIPESNNESGDVLFEPIENYQFGNGVQKGAHGKYRWWCNKEHDIISPDFELSKLGPVIELTPEEAMHELFLMGNDSWNKVRTDYPEVAPEMDEWYKSNVVAPKGAPVFSSPMINNPYIPSQNVPPQEVKDTSEYDVIPIDEFINGCKCSALTDDDGIGYALNDNNEIDKSIPLIPSKYREIPEHIKTVVWYNK